MTMVPRQRSTLWVVVGVVMVAVLATVVAILQGSRRVKASTAMDAVVDNDESALVAALGAGADPDAADHNGTTALHMAAVLGYPRAASVLLAYGANPNVADKLGETPLYFAARGLLARAYDPKSEPGRNAVAALLLCNGAKVNALAIDGTVPLHHAADRGNVLLVCMLMAHGADPTAHAGPSWMRKPLDVAASPQAKRLLARLNGDTQRPTTTPATTTPAQ